DQRRLPGAAELESVAAGRRERTPTDEHVDPILPVQRRPRPEAADEGGEDPGVAALVRAQIDDEPLGLLLVGDGEELLAELRERFPRHLRAAVVFEVESA